MKRIFYLKSIKKKILFRVVWGLNVVQNPFRPLSKSFWTIRENASPKLIRIHQDTTKCFTRKEINSYSNIICVFVFFSFSLKLHNTENDITHVFFLHCPPTDGTRSSPAVRLVPFHDPLAYSTDLWKFFTKKNENLLRLCLMKPFFCFCFCYIREVC